MTENSSPVATDTERAHDASVIGAELMGPVYAEFFQRLHTFMHAHEPGVRRFFLARAGVRLRRLYLIWCGARGVRPADTEVLWVSRLLATKGLYGVDNELFQAMILKEFPGRTIGEVVVAMSRQGERVELGKLRDRSVGDMVQLVEAGKMPVLERFLTQESSDVRAYLQSVFGDAERAFLIDSGWHGTLHRLIDPLVDADLTSLYLARVRRAGEPGPVAHALVGLLLEADTFDRSVPESALLFHRHLVEAPLEPPTPSIERVAVRADGSFDIPARVGSDRIDWLEPSDQMFLGIESYLGELGNKPAFEVHADYVAAIDALADRILYPTRSGLAGLDMGRRSSDFGKEHSAPVLLDPVERFDGDRPETRISDSLWPQGQAVLEYGELGAIPAHRSLAGDITQEDYFHPWKQDSDADEDRSVAVVMRTKDRPVLLRRAVASVAKQTHRNFQLVIVNDGGSLGPVLDIVRSSDIPRSSVSIISNARSIGMEAASNLGVRLVDTRFVVIHDDDDSWDRQFLAKTTAFLAKDPSYQGVVTQTTYVSEEVIKDEVVVRAKRPYNAWLKTINLAELSGTNLFAPIAFVFRRSVYDECGGYPEHLPVLGDWHFNLRVLTKGDVAVLDETLAFYHHRDVGSSIAYGNSVVAGRSKHLEYDARVRNEMFRSMSDGGPLGHLTLSGYMLKSLREEVRQVKAAATTAAASTQKKPRPVAEPHDSRVADTVWLALIELERTKAETQAHWWRSLLRGKPEEESLAELDWQRIEELASRANVADSPPPPDFNEKAYLRQNPDVREAIADPANDLKSGWQHYHGWGRAEGRKRPTVKPGS